MPVSPARPKDRQRFADFLRAQGYKSTPERLAVLEEVLGTSEHFTVDDLYDRLRKRRDRRVSRATIYRTLELLAESGLVNKIDWIAATTHYELAHDDEHHDHFLCSHCGQIYEFFSPTLERIQDEVCEALGLVAEEHTLKISGIPGHCRSQLIANPVGASAERRVCPFGFVFHAEQAETV